MKKIIIALITLLSIFLVSCSINGTSKKAVEEGKIAIVSKEYEKAKDLFKLASDEDSKNTEAKSLLDLTNSYIGLLEIINTGEFDKADELISTIENNEKLDIIKDEFEKTKSNIIDNKEKIVSYTSKIEAIEKTLDEGNIDEAKSLAIAKLEEVKGIKLLEDRLSSIVEKIDEKIANAKSEIIKYYEGGYDIKYRNMEIYSNNSDIEELKGKAILNFIEDQQYGSPQEYMYRMEDGAIFRLDQGSYYWVNNGYKEIYGLKDKAQENLNEENGISLEEAKEIITNYFLSTHTNYTHADIDVGVSSIIENNKYSGAVAQNSGNFKVVAEYYVDATTGEISVFGN